MTLQKHTGQSIKQHLIWFVLVVIGLFGLTAISHSVSALETAQSASSDGPQIRAFVAYQDSVSRSALADNTARIPVAWSVENRPIRANLYFEQILPDNGEAVNVELPRPWTWVSSSGEGVVAPMLPPPGADQITLRLSVINWINWETLASYEINLSITETSPTITRFDLPSAVVTAEQLKNRTANVPVSWRVEERPANSNLIFEQVMPNGEIRNVEFPRPNPYVASSGNGAMNPYYPGDGVQDVIFQLRVVNTGTGSTLATQRMGLRIVNEVPEPRFALFSSSANVVNRVALDNGTANIPVAWIVQNRPANSNLYFEQIMVDGTRRNIEFPRPWPYVASEGNGAVRPVYPGGNVSRIEIIVRLQDLNTSQTLASESILLDIAIPTEPITFGVQPMIAQPLDMLTISWDLPTTDPVRINWEFQRDGVWGEESIAGGLNTVPADGSTTLQIPADISGDRIIFTVKEPANIINPITVNIGQIEVSSFNISKNEVAPGQTVNINWQTAGAPSVTLWVSSPGWQGERPVADSDVVALGHQGSINVDVPNDAQDTVTYMLRAAGRGENAATATLTVSDADGCIYPWFAEINQGTACADAAPMTAQAAYQRFERGFMIWREGEIWVFPNNGSGQVITDTFTGDDVFWPETPPANLVQPIGGFGKAWVDNQWIRDALGWGISAEESYMMEVQSGAVQIVNDGSGRMYTFTLPDGRTAQAFISGPSIVTWEF